MPMVEMLTTNLSCRVTTETAKVVDELAKKQGVRKSDIVKETVDILLNRAWSTGMLM